MRELRRILLFLVVVGATFPLETSAGVLVNDTYIDVVLQFTEARDIAAQDQQFWPVLRAICRLPSLPIVPGAIDTLRKLEQRIDAQRNVQQQLCRVYDYFELIRVLRPSRVLTAFETAAEERRLVAMPAIYAKEFSGGRFVAPYDDGTYLMTIVHAGVPARALELVAFINNGTFSDIGVTEAHVVVDTAAVFGLNSGFVELVGGQTELSLGWHVILVVGTLLICGVAFTLATRTFKNASANDDVVEDEKAAPSGSGDAAIGGDADDDDAGTGLAQTLLARKSRWEEPDLTTEMQVRLQNAAAKEPERLHNLLKNTAAIGVVDVTPKAAARTGAANTSAELGYSAMHDESRVYDDEPGDRFFPPQLRRGASGATLVPLTSTRVGGGGSPGGGLATAAELAGAPAMSSTKALVKKKDFSLEKLQNAISLTPSLNMPLSHQAAIAQENEENRLRAEREAERVKALQAQQSMLPLSDSTGELLLDLPPVKTEEDYRREEEERVMREAQKKRDEMGLSSMGLGLQARRMAAMMSTLKSPFGALRRSMTRASELPRVGRIRAFFSMSGNATPGSSTGGGGGGDATPMGAVLVPPTQSPDNIDINIDDL